MTCGMAMKAADHLTSVVASWEDARGVKLCDLLKMSDEAYTEHRGALLNQTKDAMQQYVATTDTARAWETSKAYDKKHPGESQLRCKMMLRTA